MIAARHPVRDASLSGCGATCDIPFYRAIFPDGNNSGCPSILIRMPFRQRKGSLSFWRGRGVRLKRAGGEVKKVL